MDSKSRYIRCLRCNRILKTEIAQIRGYGNICWKKHLANNDLNLFNITLKKGENKK